MAKATKAVFRFIYITIKMWLFGYSEYKKMELAIESLIISFESSIKRTYSITEQIRICEDRQLEAILSKLKPIIVKDFLMHIQLIRGGHPEINKAIKRLENIGQMNSV